MRASKTIGTANVAPCVLSVFPYALYILLIFQKLGRYLLFFAKICYNTIKPFNNRRTMGFNRMITIKDYAARRNKSVQAVHQQLKRKNNAAALEGHIHVCKINNRNVKCLDEAAVEILDASSSSTPSVVIQTDNSAIIEHLREEREQLLLKIAVQADKIAELAEWKSENAVRLAEADQQKLLAADLKTENEKLQSELEKYEKTVFGLYKKRG